MADEQLNPQAEPATADTLGEAPARHPSEPTYAGELRDLIQRAQKGDVAAMPQLQAFLDEHPDIWQQVGDLAALVERSWLALFGSEHPLVAESFQRTLATMKTELAGEQPTPLERLLVEQVVVCWLEVQHCERLQARSETVSPKQAQFCLKRLESAQKRYLAAIKTLTTVRALVPAGLVPAPAIRLHKHARKRA